MKKIEDRIRKYLKVRKWDQLRPSDVAKSISIEAGELLELFQWTNETIDEVKQNKEKLQKLKSELADVLTYAIDMAVLLDINCEEIIEKKLQHVEKKYPAKLMAARINMDPGTEDVYQKIKEEYRRKGLN